MAVRRFAEYVYSIRIDGTDFGTLTKKVYDDKTADELFDTIESMTAKGGEMILLSTRKGEEQSSERVVFPGKPYQRTVTEWAEVSTDNDPLSDLRIEKDVLATYAGEIL